MPSDDFAEMVIAVTAHDGAVYMKLQGRQGTIALMPVAARSLAEVLEDCANQAEGLESELVITDD